MLDVLPKELVALVLEFAATAGDMGRAGMTSRALCWVLSDAVLWKRAAVRRLGALGVDTGAAWVRDVLAEMGGVWVRRVTDNEKPPGHTGMAFSRRSLSRGKVVFGEFADGWLTGYGVVWNSRENLLTLGNWSTGRFHGRMTRIQYPSRKRSVREYEAGVRHGAQAMYQCACRPDDDPRPNASPPESYPLLVMNQHLELHGRANKFGESGCIETHERKNGSVIGSVHLRFCNGDVHEWTYDEKGTRVTMSDRFVMSPACADPLFRAFEIRGVMWKNQPLVKREPSKGGGYHVMTHPDPETAPHEFRLFHEYYKRGHLMEERGRDGQYLDLRFEGLAQKLPPEVASLDLADLIAQIAARREGEEPPRKKRRVEEE